MPLAPIFTLADLIARMKDDPRLELRALTLNPADLDELTAAIARGECPSVPGVTLRASHFVPRGSCVVETVQRAIVVQTGPWPATLKFLGELSET